MRIYYAHAICTYGTQTERAERKVIRARFPKCRIIDPGNYEGNIEKRTKGMSYCFGLIAKCDVLVFARLLNQITSGVGLEIVHALSKGISVYELDGQRVKTIKKKLPFLSREATVDLYNVWRLNEWRKPNGLES
jgi:hypothetical protein